MLFVPSYVGMYRRPFSMGCWQMQQQMFKSWVAVFTVVAIM
jgi:hypothetical protein